MDGYVTIGTELDTKSFDKQIAEVESELRTLEKRYEETKNMKPFKGQEEDLQRLELEIEKTNNKLIQLNKEKEKASKVKVNDINKELKTTSSNLTGILKKVGKWSLALFGIRSAYSMIRKAMSTLTQYNEQLETDLNYINFAISKALEPIIEYIIKLVYELLGLLNRISKFLFGYDLFANAGADAFKRANKNAKNLQKTLASFDKVNVLGKNVSTSGGAKTPSFNLGDDIGTSNLENLIDNIKQKFNEAFNNIKTNIKTSLKEAFGLDDDTLKGLEDMIEGARSMFNGLFDLVDGTMTLIIGVLSGDPEKVKTGWQNMINGIGEILKGFVAQAFGWKETLLNYVSDFLNNVEKKFGLFGSIVVSPVKNAIDTIKNIFSGLKTSFTNILDGIVKIFKGDFSGIEDIAIGAINTIITALNALISGINVIASPLRLLIVGIGKVLGKNYTLENIKIPSIPLVGVNNNKSHSGGSGRHFANGGIVDLPSLARGSIVNMPGRGVTYGGATMGEGLGQGEGIVPLSNEASLEKIGSAIAKHTHITINLTNEMDSRIIAKIMKEINNENNFATNGG